MRIISGLPQSIKPSPQKIKRSVAVAAIFSASALPIKYAKIAREVNAHKAYTFCKIPPERTQQLTSLAKSDTKEQKYKKLIKRIIEDDKNAPNSDSLERIISHIISISKEYDVNPIEIACIVKKESHFIEKLNGKFGKGLMQINEPVTRDMFQRPNIYHPKLSDFLSKYKTPSQLFQDLQKNSEANIRTGILLYNSILKRTNGNIRKALEKYNSSKHKKQYAQSVLADINKYKKMFLE